MSSPVICFGQQPCGFFPRRFLYAKFVTARRLQREIGGEIVFFYHDSDHDSRETQTILRHRKTNAPATLNFTLDINDNKAKVSGTARINRTAFGVGQGQWASTDAIAAAVSIDFRFSATARK